jgi:phosphocarrier protein
MSAPQPTAVPEASGRVALTHPDGLHARPSVKLTKLAKTFAATIEFAPADAGPWTDAKSIVRVMAAKLSRGSVLHFRAAGPDAQAAVDALVALVARDFDDGGADDDDSA